MLFRSDGRSLNSEWESETVAYKGITVSGYPNYFKINGPNTGTGHSSQLTYMETMANYIVKAICAVKRDDGIKAIDSLKLSTTTRNKVYYGNAMKLIDGIDASLFPSK